MKQIIVALALSATACHSAYAQTLLKVSTADKQAINVALDGRYFNTRGTSVTVGDLPAGRHYIQIYGVITKRNGRQREAIIYEGNVGTYNNMITLFIFDPSTGGVDVHEEDVNAYARNNQLPAGAPVPPVGNDNTAGNNTVNNDDGSGGNVASPVTIDNPSTLTDAKIDQLKTNVTAGKTDTDKMKVLQEALKNETITTDQVAYIMDWLSFESSKLDFVKWAYNLTADKDNYSMLEGKFTYKNYQDDFVKFVQEKH